MKFATLMKKKHLNLNRRLDILLANFFKDTTSTNDSQSGMLSSVLASGFVFGLLVLGPIAHSLQSRQKRTFVMGLCGVMLACLATITILSKAHSPNASPAVMAALLFILAASTSLQYFIFPSVFAVQFGKETNIVGVVSAFLDAVRFFLLLRFVQKK
jgi:MFS family permease